MNRHNWIMKLPNTPESRAVIAILRKHLPSEITLKLRGRGSRTTSRNYCHDVSLDNAEFFVVYAFKTECYTTHRRPEMMSPVKFTVYANEVIV